MTILDTIVAQKRLEVARLPQRNLSASDLECALKARGENRDFLGALHRPPQGTMALIAEVKKASPSAGVICHDFDPVRIARQYEAAGAACLSVLTDEKFFQGSLDYLRQVRQAVTVPLLRKDFIIDERQILEAIEWGADAVLLIVAILNDRDLGRFHALATEAGLAALVEVHDETELDRALAVRARLIGVNNRNLKTFKVDLATTERLSARMGERYQEAGDEVRLPQPSATSVAAGKVSGSGLTNHAASVPAGLLVAESGIHTRADVERLARAGARAILVGESLMRSPDPGARIRELLGF